jgi:hypothetical protein
MSYQVPCNVMIVINYEYKSLTAYFYVSLENRFYSANLTKTGRHHCLHMHQKQSSPPVTPQTVQLLFLDNLSLVTHSTELHADKLDGIPLNFEQKKNYIHSVKYHVIHCKINLQQK